MGILKKYETKSGAEAEYWHLSYYEKREDGSLLAIFKPYVSSEFKYNRKASFKGEQKEIIFPADKNPLLLKIIKPDKNSTPDEFVKKSIYSAVMNKDYAPNPFFLDGSAEHQVKLGLAPISKK